MDQRFRKEEHLKSRKLIQQLFKDGKAIKTYPVLLAYLPVQQTDALQVGFSVSKKKFKKAVDRNLLKRRMREAYRLNRNAFCLHEVKNCVAMFVYLPSHEVDYSHVEKGVKKALNQLQGRLTSPGNAE